MKLRIELPEHTRDLNTRKPHREFHICRKARDFYQFEESLFEYNGRVIIANFYAARVFAQKMNAKKDLLRYPEKAIKAGQINAIGLMDEIFHVLVGEFQRDMDPNLLTTMLNHLNEHLGTEKVDQTLRLFIEEFPPVEVYTGVKKPDVYLEENLEYGTNRMICLEELLILYVHTQNPALSNVLDLFDTRRLERHSAYGVLVDELQSFFQKKERQGPEKEGLLDLLLMPARRFPHSIEQQLELIRTTWKKTIGRLMVKILGSLDLISEENKIVFGGPGPIEVMEYPSVSWIEEEEGEPEQFSPDLDWMPRLVLLAKNTYVWMDQLSKKYDRRINTLDAIPDEELLAINQQGFTGLWLIGVWERSRASKQIKQLCGNPEALASAYSLYNYNIAEDLGGETAFLKLRERAWRYNIRLASDMVPNHMGIDSPWVVHHPDWFMHADQPPYPVYSYTGPNLSGHPDAEIYIEDHYYNRSDAAVVFKHQDHRNQKTRYIYHGNDGTDMPWNDTAQLDYLNPAVREAVIQTIIAVARRFPIIRFDAAMTLAKRHYQRLWYPEPGSGGAIPSRSEFALTKDAFNKQMPIEFWREVVDRVAEEVPDTLLLAEAFWLMEGYFVRTLGMHRVYNSAFMHMLRDEDNAKYRSVMKNTLEFDPEILKRFVNFMNNPDEKTAVEQFGKGDKYFGACMLLATLPGLPMFGHGQIEGFSEKYGMEYKKAYRDETPDQWLIEHHQRIIFPVLHRRYLFAEAEHFLLYDVESPDGHINEDIIAFSNRFGNEKALVVFHNKYASAQGRIRLSTAFADKSLPEENRLVRRTLAYGLNLKGGNGYFCLFRDHISGLEFLRSSDDLIENGFDLSLSAYSHQLFWDFREMSDTPDGKLAALNQYLQGKGVPDLEEAHREIFLENARKPLKEILSLTTIQEFIKLSALNKTLEAENKSLIQNLKDKYQSILTAIAQTIKSDADLGILLTEYETTLHKTIQILFGIMDITIPAGSHFALNLAKAQKAVSSSVWDWTVLLGWLSCSNLGKILQKTDFEQISVSWIDEWKFGKTILNSLVESQETPARGEDASALIKILILNREILIIPAESTQTLHQRFARLFSDPDAQNFLGVNRYKNILWFNKDAYDQFLKWLNFISFVHIWPDEFNSKLDRDFYEKLKPLTERIKLLETISLESNFRVEKFLEILKQRESGNQAAPESPEGVTKPSGT